MNNNVTQPKGDSILESVKRKYYTALAILVVSIFTIGTVLLVTDNGALGTPVLLLVFILGNVVLFRLLGYKCLNCNQAAFRGKNSPSFKGQCVHCGAKIP